MYYLYLKTAHMRNASTVNTSVLRKNNSSGKSPLQPSRKQCPLIGDTWQLKEFPKLNDKSFNTYTLPPNQTLCIDWASFQQDSIKKYPSMALVVATKITPICNVIDDAHIIKPNAFQKIPGTIHILCPYAHTQIRNLGFIRAHWRCSFLEQTANARTYLLVLHQLFGVYTSKGKRLHVLSEPIKDVRS